MPAAIGQIVMLAKGYEDIFVIHALTPFRCGNLFAKAIVLQSLFITGACTPAYEGRLQNNAGSIAGKRLDWQVCAFRLLIYLLRRMKKNSRGVQYYMVEFLRIAFVRGLCIIGRLFNRGW